MSLITIICMVLVFNVGFVCGAVWCGFFRRLPSAVEVEQPKRPSLSVIHGGRLQ